jgi:hypothetical protein
MKQSDVCGELKGEDELNVCDECSMGFCDECEHMDDYGEDATERENVEIAKAIGSDTCRETKD